MVIAVIVHPIDTDKHPTIPAGFRWCAQFGTDAADVSSYLNAGWEANATDAAITGEMVASAVAKALMVLGIQRDYVGVIQLAEDPIPAEDI
jgi:hypothetical protein